MFSQVIARFLVMTTTLVAPVGSFFSIVELAQAKPTKRYLDDFLFEKFEQNKPDLQLPVTDAVVVLHRGNVVYERYARGYHAKMPHLLFSVSKSVTNAVVGQAIQDGYLALEDSVCNHIRPNPSTNLSTNLGTLSCDMTVRHLMQMSSGIDWKEGYDREPEGSHVLQMLYGLGSANMGAYVRALPLRAAPGTTWNYSSGDTNVIMEVLKSALPSHVYATYPQTRLFEPLGISSAVWERDASGTFIGSSNLYLTARDAARFGELFLHSGEWHGQRLLPADWVAESTRLVPAFPTGPGARKPYYGMQWWLNAPHADARGEELAWPDAPADAFAAIGYWGQYIFVIPSLDIVAVRFGEDRNTEFDVNRFLALVQKETTSKQGAVRSISLPTSANEQGGEPRRGKNKGRVAGLSHAQELPPVLVYALLGFSAKETCSCRFVVGQTEEFCAQFATQLGWPMPEVEVIQGKGGTLVRSRLGDSLRTARLIHGEGCTLD